jgi:hypothetical protein
MFHLFHCAQNIKGNDIPPHRLLPLYGASHSETDYQEEKVESGVPKYTIGYSSAASLRRSAYSTTPPQFFPRWDEKRRITRRNSAATYYKRSGTVPERNLYCTA